MKKQYGNELAIIKHLLSGIIVLALSGVLVGLFPIVYLFDLDDEISFPDAQYTGIDCMQLPEISEKYASQLSFCPAPEDFFINGLIFLKDIHYDALNGTNIINIKLLISNCLRC
jgi:hypothetical protein